MRPVISLLSFLVPGLSLVFLADGGSPEVGKEKEIELYQAHYRRVEEELLRRDISSLSAEQRAVRETLIQELAAYRERGIFTSNPDFPDERMPYFVDGEGRLCAVANLLRVCSQEGLVKAVAAIQNHAFVADLTESSELLAWLEHSGITLREAARIQMPVPFGNSKIRVGESPSAGNAPRPPTKGTYSGPSDGTGGATPAPTLPGGSSPSVPSGPSPTNGIPTGAPTGMKPGGVVSGGLEGWAVWWEMNKLDFLRPNRLGEKIGPFTGDDLATGFSKEWVEKERQALLPLLNRFLEDPDPIVRCSAAIAVGRVGGRSAVQNLISRFSDSNQWVRNRAILALGATGSREAEHLLLRIAANGKPTDDGQKISPLARPMALLALAVGHKHGFGREADSLVSSFSRGLDGDGKVAVGLGLALYQTLAPFSALRGFVLEAAADQGTEGSLRCRSVEALRHETDRESLAFLTRAINGPNLEIRRSAALALGEFRHPLALPALQTAFELEKDALTRGFALISIGRQGGGEAVDFLLRAIKEGGNAMHPWSALALGIAAREGGSPEAKKAIREAFAKEGNQDFFGAYLLASGIARDAEAVSEIRRVLVASKNPDLRGHAALALAMTGDSEVRAILLQKLQDEKSIRAKVSIAQALGILGDSRDVGAMLSLLRDLRDPSERVLIAVALGFHGSPEAVKGLLDVIQDPKLYGSARSAAIDSLAILLGEGPSLSMSEVFRQANYSVFPAWILDLATVVI